MNPFSRRRQDPLAGLPSELQRVLDAAAAPGLASELTGLSAVTAAYTSTAVTPNDVEPAVSWNLAKLIATPVAAVVAVTGLTGGVALAAATGSLPAAVQDLAAKIGAPEADRGDEAGPATPTATVKLNRGRCVAVTMGNKTTNGKALETAPLSAAAAGCPSPAATPGSNRSETATAKLGAKPSKAPKPAKTATPTAKPSKAPKVAPTARPTDAGKPTSAPTARPTDAGKPTSAPAGRPTDAGKPSGK